MNQLSYHYNYSYFYGVGSLIFNDELGFALSEVFRKSELKHPLLENLAKDLSESDEVGEVVEENGSQPSYDYGHFNNKGTLTLNFSMAQLISQAISSCNMSTLSYEGADKSLWALHYVLRCFDKTPEKKTVVKNFESV